MDARKAVALACALSFAAGAALGALASGREEPLATPSLYPEYERRFVETFDPSDSQVRALRELFRIWKREEDAIKNRYADVLEPDLRALAARVEAAVREDILTPEQRDRYDRLLASSFGDAGGG